MLNPTTRDRAWISAHVPHQGRMCLIERVLGFDDSHVVCEAVDHTDPAHPLRDHGRLGAAIGVEYAAQAMAVHGALLAADAGSTAPGYLGSVRALQLHTDRLDTAPSPLRIEATRLSGSAQLILYRFTVAAQGRCLLEGRASVVLGAEAMSLPSRSAGPAPEREPQRGAP